MSGLRVLKAGILSQIQDRGRVGYGDIGITQSGVADGYSAAWANRLLFDPADSPLLEILLGGVVLLAKVDTFIAVTGAQTTLEINGESAALWRTHAVKSGDKIEIGMASSGLRLYLAAKGGFRCMQVLGSCATTLKEGLGSKVRKDDLLVCNECTSLPLASTPKALIADYSEVLTLRLELGYQADLFTAEQRALFFSSPYLVTQETDRMGCRLQGEPLGYEAGELISEPIAYGSVQIPPDGQPIVLLNERQTIGGYPKIGAVIPMDCYRLAQARPGTTVAFQEIGREEAVRVTKVLLRFLEVP